MFHPKRKKGRRNAPNGPGPAKGCHAKGKFSLTFPLPVYCR